MKKVRVGDEVQVIAGRDKGKRGKVIAFVKGKDTLRVIVQGAQLVKKHVKPNPKAGVEGGVVEKEASIDFSNIALVDSETSKISKVGIKVTESGVKVRYFKSTNRIIEQA